MKMAEDWIGEAKKNQEIGSYRSAYSSAYMCFFHAARAILYMDGYREKSHYCIGIYLEHLSDMKRIEPKWALLFDNFRNSRHNEQYNFSSPPSMSEVRMIIDDALSFLERVRHFIK
jgi:uncharacterized protein (UPF0332 family)